VRYNLIIVLSFYRWEGEGLNEVGKEKSTGIVRVRIKEQYFRPSEVVSCE
jgi:GDP-D-mannose dehydratase